MTVSLSDIARVLSLTPRRVQQLVATEGMPREAIGTSEYPRHLLDGRRVLWFTIATGLLAQAKALGREDW